jgi:amino-acid N-acetyltransferase
LTIDDWRSTIDDSSNFQLQSLRLEPAHIDDITTLSELNNQFSPQGLTLPRSESWVSNHIDDYRVVRDEHGHVLGCVCLDDYSPSLVELVSLAVSPEHQGQGLGSALIGAAVDLARRRGYPELFAVSFSDTLFQQCGFRFVDINRYPEKRSRYAKVSDDEWAVGQKHCFVIELAAPNQPGAGGG